MTDETSQAPDAAASPVAGDSAPEAPATARLEQENSELKDRILRTLAEMENLRRRTEREVSDSRTYGVASFARDVLGVADNMRRAIEATGPDWREQADAPGQALLDGVELTERELLKVLEKHGVKKLEPMGQKFDPNLHQAMYEVPDASVPSGTVVQVMQAGFTIGERILRPALVGVAKGGAKSGPTASSAQNDNAHPSAAANDSAPP